MTLSALIALVEAADGPSREIDAAVDGVFHTSSWDFENECIDPWPVTASIDAVVALIGREMPGAFVETQGPFINVPAMQEGVYRAFIRPGGYFHSMRKMTPCGSASTEPLARLLAFLRAKQAKENTL